MSRFSLRYLAAATVVTAGLLAGGCGGSSTTTSTTTTSPAPTSPASEAPATSSAGAQVLRLAANPSGALSYSTTTLHARPGKVTIVFTNMAPLSHNVTVEAGSGAKLGATPTFTGGTRSLTLNLKAGTYSFFCSVPGHRQAGMQGTLTVSG